MLPLERRIPMHTWPERRLERVRDPATGLRLRACLVVAGALGLSLALGKAFRELGSGDANVVLAFLLGVALVASVAGRWASIAASVLSVLAFNFFFTEPLHTFAVADLESLVTFAALLLTGLTVSALVERLRRQAARAREQANASEVLHRVGRALAAASGPSAVAQVARDEIRRRLHLDARLLLGDPRGAEPASSDPVPLAERPPEPDVAPRYLPLLAKDGRVLGSLGLFATAEGAASGAAASRDSHLVASLASLISLALEREELSAAARASAVEAETERLRGDLLAVVSHDLRTPLASIHGAASTLLERGERLTQAERAGLLAEVLGESRRLARLVENLLQLGRTDGGRLLVPLELYPFDELAGTALARLGRQGGGERVRLDVPPDLPLLAVDGELCVLLLLNLLENALCYSPEGPIEVVARAAGGRACVSVLDRGPGLPPGDPGRLFERFVRGTAERSMRGSGLGLAIARAICLAHGGTIVAERRPGGGACFRFEVPTELAQERSSEPAARPGGHEVPARPVAPEGDGVPA